MLNQLNYCPISILAMIKYVMLPPKRPNPAVGQHLTRTRLVFKVSVLCATVSREQLQSEFVVNHILLILKFQLLCLHVVVHQLVRRLCIGNCAVMLWSFI